MKHLKISAGSLALPSLSGGVDLYIAGDYSFNNDVLAGHISEKAEMPCHGIHSSQLKRLCKIGSEKPVFLFLDCAAKGVRKACDHACFQKQFFLNPHHKTVCFNIDPNTDRDKKALKRGVDGVIYPNQSVTLFIKTIRAVLSGELWYPRHLLEQHLINSQPPPCCPSMTREILLTKREREVLNLLTTGMRNIDISKALCISPHTVKTHVYNLFRKIQVTNRYEAAQWLLANR